MSFIDEKLTDQFYQWELRGRGWQVFEEPVHPEPPFRPFWGHYLPDETVIDDGRRPTFLSSLIQKISRKLGDAPPIPEAIEEEVEPEPELLERDGLIEIQANLPPSLKTSRDEFELFLLNLSLCLEPVAFELLSLPPNVTLQFVTHQKDETLVRQALKAVFPDVVFLSQKSALEKTWNDTSGEPLVVDFGLHKEFMFSLATGKIDPFIGIAGALSGLKLGEIGLYQVIFYPVRHPWAESVLRAVTDNSGQSFFVNAPELFDEAKKKISRPLYAAVVRIAAKSADDERNLEILRPLASAMGVFSRPSGNELIPLENGDYPLYFHEKDLTRRQSRRSGMLLNSDELLGFVHLPSSEVRTPELRRQTGKTKMAPTAVLSARGLLLGNNTHAGQSMPVRISSEERVRHMHVIGASGTGKSTLLFNLIRQDIENGEGVAVLDPHGDLVDWILGVIPLSRIKDVVLLDPSDEEYSIGFNILSAHSDLEKNLLASDLVSVFQRLSTSWGDQMASVLNNAILAFLESDRGGTLSDLRRFLLEPGFREQFLKSVRDPDIVYYWQKGFVQLSGNKSIGSVITRLDTFLSRKPIRYMVSQKENRLDFGSILDTGKIFLGKLAQGTIGKENSYLLGTLIVSKLQQIAMSRQRQAEANRKDFFLYIDEAPNFITPTMAEILTGARKYRLGLILAHQELRQLDRDKEVASAILSNPFTRICFRVGDQDARALESGFSYFEAKDLQNLGTGEAICRVERSDFDFNLKVIMPEAPLESEALERRKEVISASREKYGTARKVIEEELYRDMEAPERKAETKARTKPEPNVEQKQEVSPTATLKSTEVIPSVKEAPPKPREQGKEPEEKKDEAPKVHPAEIVKAKMIAPVTPLPLESEIKAIAEAAEYAARFAQERETKPKSTSPPKDMGRGGPEHQALQKRLKGVAEGLGYMATVEKPVLDGTGSVDLALEKPNRSIACEISITTSIDHEVQNVRKCLKAGFPSVAVICQSKEHLGQIQAAVQSSLGKSETTSVGYFTPDDFIGHLQTIALEDVKNAQAPERKRGYIVKRRTVQLTPSEAKAREEATLDTIIKTIRKKKDKG